MQKLNIIFEIMFTHFFFYYLSFSFSLNRVGPTPPCCPEGTYQRLALESAFCVLRGSKWH